MADGKDHNMCSSYGVTFDAEASKHTSFHPSSLSEGQRNVSGHEAGITRYLLVWGFFSDSSLLRYIHESSMKNRLAPK